MWRLHQFKERCSRSHRTISSILGDSPENMVDSCKEKQLQKNIKTLHIQTHVLCFSTHPKTHTVLLYTSKDTYCAPLHIQRHILCSSTHPKTRTVLLYTFRLNKTSGLDSEKCTGGKQFTDGMTMLLCTHFEELTKLSAHNQEDQDPSESKQHLSCDYTIIRHKCSFL